MFRRNSSSAFPSGEDARYLQSMTSRARRALSAAQHEAHQLDRTAVDVEHLLLGLLRDPNDAAAQALTRKGIDHARLLAEVNRCYASTEHTPAPSAAGPGLTAAARRALEYAAAAGLAAVRDGTRARAGMADTLHLLAGALSAVEGVSAQALHALGFDPTQDHSLALLGMGQVASTTAPLSSATKAETPVHSITCPSCGQAVRPGWKHCIYCGTTLNACPTCGAPRQDVPGEAFCAECGASLHSTTDLPTVPLITERASDEA